MYYSGKSSICALKNKANIKISIAQRNRFFLQTYEITALPQIQFQARRENIKDVFSMFPLNTAVKTVYTLEHHFYCSRSHCFPEGTHLWNLVKRKERSNLQKTDLQTTLRYILHATTFWIMLLVVPWWPTGANASFMRTQVPPPALLLPSWHKTAAPAHLKTWYHHRLHLKLY